MSPSHVVEPTYRRLKSALLQGRWPVGFRLEALRLADDLGVSMTPVRDCLNRLVGERLVDLRPGEGFSVARLNERTLRDLLEFNAALLVFALHIAQLPLAAPAEPAGALDPAERIARLFEHLARSAGNTILSETIASINDRMHPLRMLDAHLLGGCAEEAADLAEALSASGDRERLRLLVLSYHDRRQAIAGKYMAMLEEPRD